MGAIGWIGDAYLPSGLGHLCVGVLDMRDSHSRAGFWHQSGS